MANERATHTVQMEPLKDSMVDQAFSLDEEDDNDFEEVPNKDLEKMLLQGLK